MTSDVYIYTRTEKYLNEIIYTFLRNFPKLSILKYWLKYIVQLIRGNIKLFYMLC